MGVECTVCVIGLGFHCAYHLEGERGEVMSFDRLLGSLFNDLGGTHILGGGLEWIRESRLDGVDTR